MLPANVAARVWPAYAFAAACLAFAIVAGLADLSLRGRLDSRARADRAASADDRRFHGARLPAASVRARRGADARPALLHRDARHAHAAPRQGLSGVDGGEGLQERRAVDDVHARGVGHDGRAAARSGHDHSCRGDQCRARRGVAAADHQADCDGHAAVKQSKCGPWPFSSETITLPQSYGSERNP